MSDDVTRKRDVSAAVEARQRIFAEAVARNPERLAKSVREVRAALRIGTLTIGDLVDDELERLSA